MGKLLSLRHWGATFSLIYKLIMSRQVLWWEKLIFIVPVAVYWISPDLMPFLPVDDIAFTMIIAEAFASRMARKYNINRTN
jgi:hypothetical protein